jgi:hypothetical protein
MSDHAPVNLILWHLGEKAMHGDISKVVVDILTGMCAC